MTFSEALNSGRVAAIRKFPKSDLHNHCMLGGRRRHLEQATGRRLRPFRAAGGGIHDLNRWILEEAKPVFEQPGGFEKGVEAAFIQAKIDGITRLEMSMDLFFGKLFNIAPERIIATLRQYHSSVAPDMEFIPELGFARNLPVNLLRKGLESFLRFDFFRSIDLYDDEFAQPAANFIELYRLAKSAGLKCKAHAGEFGTAESVRETIETLELDAVQHGIAAAGSPEVMRWLARNRVPLNVCPASNIRLKRARSYRTHPIRILADHGVVVTINTDDALVFGAGNSEQFLKLFREGVFSATELEEIRNNGLNA